MHSKKGKKISRFFYCRLTVEDRRTVVEFIRAFQETSSFGKNKSAHITKRNVSFMLETDWKPNSCDLLCDILQFQAENSLKSS